jgi:hypothetical protein
LFREQARAGDVFDADVPHLLESVDGGSVEFWIHGRGARRPFAPDVSEIVYLVHQAPGRDEVGINVYIRPRR